MPTMCCPFCAHEDPVLMSDAEGTRMTCPECGAAGPIAHWANGLDAESLWNLRYADWDVEIPDVVH